MTKPPDHHYTIEKQTRMLLDIGFSEEKADIAYAARMLFHTMIPHTAKEAREWVRKNGRVRVSIQAASEMGLPYGVYPRLVFIWIVTEAYRTKSRTLTLGQSLSDFMRQLGLLPTGGRWGTITQLREQMRRLFGAHISAFIDLGGGEAMQRMHVADEYILWWTPQSPEQAALWESTVTLGERFFETIINKPFPVDMRIVRTLKRSPLGLDLYTWLTHRVSYMKEPVVISWRQLHAQFGADYTGRYGLNEFTKATKRELKKIEAAWPKLRYETPRGRLKLLPSSPSIKQVK